MAEGGGTGITTMPVLQSLAQAREKWSENAAGAIWDASIVKIILGGASNSRDLQDLTTLIGERDEITDSTTVGDHGSRSAQRSIRRVPIMPPDVIRTLPFGTGSCCCAPHRRSSRRCAPGPPPDAASCDDRAGRSAAASRHRERRAHLPDGRT
jgi:hypothetical protein